MKIYDIFSYFESLVVNSIFINNQLTYYIHELIYYYKFHFKEREEIIVALKEENERLLSKARCVEGDEANDEECSPDNAELK